VVSLGIAAAAAVTYTWGARRGSLEVYYQAAVRSMGSSWHDFVFGAFDPAGTVSVDKLPGALWVQALSVRVFGYHPWAILLPQAVEGVATVLVLFRAVRRLAGDTAGVVAAGVVAVTPVTVSLDRGNISDSLLILLLVLAADATVSALVRRHGWWLVAAGVWVGLAFQAKMLEAWLVLPALGAGWLVAGPGRVSRRTLQFGAAVAVTAVVSLSWMTAVGLVPRADRPFVDGSTTDSLYQQVFVYNGFGRVDTATPGLAGGAAGASSFAALADFRLPAGPGPFRLLSGPGGRAVGWLVPVALVSGVAVLVERRRRPRTDRRRAAVLLFGTWLVVDLIAFSVLSGINAYYLAALAPAVGALGGLGVDLVRRHGAADRRVAVGAVVVASLSVAYGAVLAAPAPGAVRLVVAAVAVVLVGAGAWLLLRRPGPGRRRWGDGAVTGGILLLAAVALLPAAASAGIVVDGLGPFDTPWQPASVTQVTQVEPRRTLQELEAGVPLLEQVNAGHRYLAATATSIVAAPLIVDSGREIEPIGGFTGSIPSPALDELIDQVDSGQLRTVIVTPGDDPRLVWVRSHCTEAPPSLGIQGGPVSGLSIEVCAPGPGTGSPGPRRYLRATGLRPRGGSDRIGRPRAHLRGRWR